MENTNQDQKGEPLENNENQNEEKPKQLDWLELVKTFLEGTNLKEIIEAINVGKDHETSLKKDAGSKNLTFWRYKYIKDFLVVFMVLGSILILSFNDKIENATLGTLLGSIIGYAIGNSRGFKNEN